MEHPFMFLPWLLEQVGLGDFAHHNLNVIHSWFLMALILIVGKLTLGAVKMVPGKGQNFWEVLIGGVEDFMIDTMGEEGRPFFPLIGTLFIYILIMNWSGLVPGLFAPTANINTALAMALVVFFLTHIIGIKEHGVSYIKHFLGPVWWLAPLILVIELVSHVARVLSLTFRLFGNVLGEDLVLAVLLLLAGAYFAPLPMFFLAIFTCFIQAFIFTLLTMLYIAGAMEDAH